MFRFRCIQSYKTSNYHIARNKFRIFCTESNILYFISKNHVRISFCSSLVKAYCILTYSLVPEPSEEPTRACTLECLWNQAN